MSEPTKEQVDDWKQHYQTPEVFFRWIELVLLPRHGQSRFTLDACATPWNAKCRAFIGVPGTMACEGMVGLDGLSHSWVTEGAAWCNAGFSKLEPWFNKAYSEMVRGQFSCLISHALGGEQWVRPFIDGGASHCYIVRPRVDYDEDPRFLSWLTSKGEKPAGNPKNTMVWMFDPGYVGPCKVEFAPVWPKPEKKRKGG